MTAIPAHQKFKAEMDGQLQVRVALRIKTHPPFLSSSAALCVLGGSNLFRERLTARFAQGREGTRREDEDRE